MSAPSILAKNLRTVGQGMRISAHLLGQFWTSIIRSPYRRACLGTLFAVLPISAGIAAYNFSPAEAEAEARSQQKIIEIPLEIPAISEQIDVVTSHRALATHTTMIRKNDTLASIFSRLNVSDADAVRFIRQQSRLQPLSNPREGVYVQAKVSADRKLRSLKLFLEARNAKETDTVVTMTRRGDNRFAIDSDPFVYETQQAMAAGVIRTTLEDALKSAGVPDTVAAQVPEAFERRFNNGLKLTAGDDFRLIYERKYLEGDFVRTGHLLAVAITHAGEPMESFWAADGTKNGGFYNLDGTTNQVAFIRVPVDGARVTSSFMPMRRHPVTGVLRPHQGTDFGAPKGNRIYAASDGVITRKTFNKRGYGYYMIIKHDERRSTLYGHMTRFEKGLQVGSRVKKGQVIGYVGATGLATGPHLHYELRVNNRQVNPLTTNIPDKDRLTPEEKQVLLSQARPLTTRLAMLDRIQSVKPQVAPADRDVAAGEGQASPAS